MSASGGRRRVEYKIQRLSNGDEILYALVRVAGVSRKFITMYENRNTAYRVVAVLNAARDQEKVDNE